MQQDDRIRLNHMLDACHAATAFLSDRKRNDLEEDLLLVFGLVRAIEVVGEAASKVSEQTREQYPQVPWNQIVGMRNRLIHAYFDVDTGILWNTATSAVPALAKQLEEILGD